jgi:aminomethyltransferase
LSVVEATPVVRKTALNAVHRQMGAKMVEFNGWDMPVEYPASIGCGIVNEHMAVRTGVGIFDVSHMGDIRLAGPRALAAVQHISMNDASRLAIGQAQYSALLYPQGTFVDDVIVHRLGEDEYLLVINAGTREKDFNWVRDNTRSLTARSSIFPTTSPRLRFRAEGGESAAETDRRRPERGEVLLGDARHGCAA